MLRTSSGGWVNKLWFALEYNDQRTLRHILTHGGNINHMFKEPGHRRRGQTPLLIAVSKNNHELVRFLVSAGCDLELSNSAGESPLFAAVSMGKLSMVKLLLASGSNVNCQNKKGETVIFLAIRLGRKDLVDLLIEHGINTNLATFDRTTPLLEALQLYENTCSLRRATRRSAPSNMVGIIDTLIPHSSNLNYQHPNQGTALRVALNIETTYFHDKLTISRKLMQHGAAPDRLFFLRLCSLRASASVPCSEFFTDHFFTIALLAGANLQREKAWLLTVLSELSQEFDLYGDLYESVTAKAMCPLSLESLCISKIRVSLGGPLWKKIDLLPLPQRTRECLKLKHIRMNELYAI